MTVGSNASPVLALPRLRQDQWEIAQHPAKIKVLAMGRRWGKTTLAGVLAVATASIGGKVAWIVPVYKNGRPLWRWVEAAVAPLKKAGLCHVNKSERTIEFFNGGFLGIYSADNDVSLRGESFHLVIVDEAARIPGETWTDVIMPTLADYNGDAVLISTPKGKNWFYQEWLKGKVEQDGYKSYTAPSSANPSPHIQKAAEQAKERVSDRTYKQEWLAEFLDNGGEVFRNVEARSKAKRRKPYKGDFIFGIDTARDQDYTVIIVMDLRTRTVVDMDRFHQMEWAVYHDRIKTMAEKWQPFKIIFETNSASQQFEILWRAGLPVEEFKTTALTKPQIIESLAMAFERDELMSLADDVLTGELTAYERKINPTTGRTSYSAPSTMHDDCVMALALCWFGVVNYRPTGGIYVL